MKNTNTFDLSLKNRFPITNRKKKAVKDRNNAAGYAFIAPWLIGFFFMTVIPVIISFYYSFTDFDLLNKANWVGLENYKKIFTSDTRFLMSLKVTFLFVFASVPLRLAFALVIAMILYKGTKLTGFYRVVYYLPSIIGGSVAVSVMWRQLFGSDGAVNAVLALFGIYTNRSWIGAPETAIWSLVLLAVWQFGSSMLVFLAGLKNIPKSLYESSTIDGANALQKFIKITLPMLTPVIFFNLIMQIINGFLSFTQSFIITEGKPHDTTLLYALYLYQNSFTYFKMGYGCALAWILLIIIALFTALIFKSSSYWVYYESKGDM